MHRPGVVADEGAASLDQGRHLTQGRRSDGIDHRVAQALPERGAQLLFATSADDQDASPVLFLDPAA